MERDNRHINLKPTTGIISVFITVSVKASL